jgi:SnoaL-like polyketide cyclase
MVTTSALFDVLATIEDIIGEGDRVAVRWTFRGIYRAEARPGFPSPGARCTVVTISTYRFVDGKIKDDWGVEAFWNANTPAWELGCCRSCYTGAIRCDFSADCASAC